MTCRDLKNGHSTRPAVHTDGGRIWDPPVISISTRHMLADIRMRPPRKEAAGNNSSSNNNFNITDHDFQEKQHLLKQPRYES